MTRSLRFDDDGAIRSDIREKKNTQHTHKLYFSYWNGKSDWMSVSLLKCVSIARVLLFSMLCLRYSKATFIRIWSAFDDPLSHRNWDGEWNIRQKTHSGEIFAHNTQKPIIIATTTTTTSAAPTNKQAANSTRKKSNEEEIEREGKRHNIDVTQTLF